MLITELVSCQIPGTWAIQNLVDFNNDGHLSEMDSLISN